MNAWARFVRWSRLRKLQAVRGDILDLLFDMRRERVKAAAMVSVCDSRIPIWEKRLRDVRSKIAELEDPQKMLDEALSKNRVNR